jgi:hypothetical protein
LKTGAREFQNSRNYGLSLNQPVNTVLKIVSLLLLLKPTCYRRNWSPHQALGAACFGIMPSQQENHVKNSEKLKHLEALRKGADDRSEENCTDSAQ